MENFISKILERILVGRCAYTIEECKALGHPPVTQHPPMSSMHVYSETISTRTIGTNSTNGNSTIKEKDRKNEKQHRVSDYLSYAVNDVDDGCDEDCFGPEPYVEYTPSYNRFSLRPDSETTGGGAFSSSSNHNRFALRSNDDTPSYNRFSLKGDRKDHGQDYYDYYDD
mgnify:CR=1 FL=1